MQTTLARFIGRQKGPNTSTVDRKEGIAMNQMMMLKSSKVMIVASSQ